jgi:phosphoesterase RecJ-like protein
LLTPRSAPPVTQPSPAFIDALQGARSVILTGHEHPDGDCLGAQAALHQLLTGLGKEVLILNPDPPAKSFDFLGRHVTYHAYRGGALPHCDLLVLLDCSELRRLGRMQRAVESAAPRIAVIDHHVGSEFGDGDISFVDTDAAATGELVHRLFRTLDRPLGRAAAEGVFVSLVSDTGWFRYSNTTARVFDLAADVVRAGVDASALFDVLNRRNEADSVALLADAIGRSRISLDGRFGSVQLERSVVEQGTRIGLDLDLVMEPLRSVGSIEVVAMIKESHDGGVKISLRASRDVDVQQIAAGFGGGGHKKAAGASVRGTLDSVREDVEAAVRRALDKQSTGVGRAAQGSLDAP